MTHLPYIVAAYALTLAGSAALSITAFLRLRRAHRTLALSGRPTPSERVTS